MVHPALFVDPTTRAGSDVCSLISVILLTAVVQMAWKKVIERLHPSLTRDFRTLDRAPIAWIASVMRTVSALSVPVRLRPVTTQRTPVSEAMVGIRVTSRRGHRRL